jgi:hypothetical protein
MTASPAPAPGVSRRRKVVSIVVTLLFLGGLLALGWYLSRDDAANAKVGDCISQEGSDSVEIVDCGDSAATLKVVGRVEGKTKIEAGIGISSVCDDYEDTEQMYWQGKEGEKGFVLCLAKNTR